MVGTASLATIWSAPLTNSPRASAPPVQSVTFMSEVDALRRGSMQKHVHTMKFKRNGYDVPPLAVEQSVTSLIFICTSVTKT